MALALLVDFDGTVASTDASFEVLSRFAPEEWKAVEKEALEGRMTILEALKAQAGMVKAGPEEISSFLREKVQLRDNFREFAIWCGEKGVYLELCSDGFGSTLEVLLAHWGLDRIPWTSNPTTPSVDGMGISFPHHREGCPVNGNCKCSHYERLMERYGTVVYVGDGTTDLCVARKADMVMARDRLLKIMRSEKRPCIAWDDWEEVGQACERLL